jgi:hypothetical protein
MSRWHCALFALLAGCVDLTPPPGIHPVDASPIEVEVGEAVDAPVSVDAAGDIDAAVDAADPPDLAPQPDLGPPDLPLVLIGHPCSDNGQCESKSCVDGVCCGGACTGLCVACNVPGSMGTCVPVPAGEDPDDECAQDPASSCGRDGTCDGQAGCSRYKQGTECAPGGCTGNTERAASTCNGTGACVAGSSKSCSPNVCMNGSCASSCTQQTDCQTGFFCDSSVCRAKRTAGQTCAMALECASGNCADKVCCNTPCTESCHSCALASAPGTCTPVPSGTDPRDNCAPEASTTCGRTGLCDGKGGCLLHPTGTACGAGQSCTGTTQTAGGACNGLGVCAPGARTACTAFRCAGSACGTTCTGPAQCQTGFACTGSTCVALPAPTLYWKLDETTGAVATDASGNNLAGTYTGTSGTPAPSTMVPALTFSDPSSRAFLRANRHAVTLANMPAVLKPANDVTISVWYRATTIDTGPGGGSAAGSELVTAGDSYLMRLHMGDVEVSKRTASGHMQCLGVVSNHLDGNWHHVAGVVSSAGMLVYVDGVQRASCPITLPIVYDRGKDLFVGRHGNDTTNAAIYDFEGNMDEVRIYMKSLSPTEVAALAAGN